MTRPIDILRAKRAARGGNPPPRSLTILSDVDRIAALPRHSPESDESKILSLVSNLTLRLKRPEGAMALRPVQALALDIAARAEGLFANIGVGRGKTLLSLLLPVVMNSRRCALLIPPGLRAQLMQKAYPELAKHWNLPEIGGLGEDKAITVVTHYETSQQKTADFLFRIKPDLVVIDEAHAFAQDSARGKRVFDYARPTSGVRVCAMSGTLIDAPLTGAARMASLTLGAGSPYPRHTRDVETLAVDVEQNDASSWGKCYGAANGNLRAAVRQRVLETPGVAVASGVEDIGASLIIRERKVKLPPEVKAARKKLVDEWTTPAGDELTEAIEFARHSIQISQGFCYRWAWPGPPDLEWLEARRGWSRAVRRKLLHATAGMDSEGLLRKAAASGAWSTPAYAPWAAVMDRKPPPTVADWISDFLVKDAVEWGRERPGIVWYEHRTAGIGAKIAAEGGWPLYAGGPDANPEISARGDRTIVCSRPAYYFGRELQAFNRMLVLCPTSSARVLEQLLGRTHRPGQRSSTVEVDVCLHTLELRANFAAARDEARLLAESAPGNEQQKILFADVLV